MALSAQLQCAALGTAHTVLAPGNHLEENKFPAWSPVGSRGTF